MMRGSPHCKSYSYADRSTLYVRTCNARLSNSKRESFIEAWSQLSAICAKYFYSYDFTTFYTNIPHDG